MSLREITSEVNIDSQTGDVDQLQLTELSRDVVIKTSTGEVSVLMKTPPVAAQIDLQSSAGEVEAEIPNIVTSKRDENYLRGTIGTEGR